MQREIKFREWDGWNDDYFMNYNPENGKDNFLNFEFEHNREVGAPLMQYIGLKDKNSKEIYEGDIIQYDDYRGVIGWNSGDKGILPGFSIELEQVESGSERSVQYRHDKACKLILNFPGNVEVIGNIYENPELLGDKNENQV